MPGTMRHLRIGRMLNGAYLICIEGGQAREAGLRGPYVERGKEATRLTSCIKTVRHVEVRV